MCSTKSTTRVLLLAISLSIVQVGCGRNSSAMSDCSTIEGALAEYTVVNMSDGDAIIGGDRNGSKVIQISPRWADFPQVLRESSDGAAGFNHISQLTFFISVGGDSFAVVEQIAKAIEADPSIADQLLQHPAPRIRYATMYTLQQSQPYRKHFPNSADSLVHSLVQLTSSADVFEVAKALDLLPKGFELDAFTNVMSHPCSQLRLAALNYLTFSDLDDSQRLVVLPVLVKQLNHRDRVVRETAFGEINSIMQHWRQQRHNKLKLAPRIVELMETVPSDPGNGNWQEAMASVSKSLTDNQAKWVFWLDSNHIAVSQDK